MDISKGSNDVCKNAGSNSAFAPCIEDAVDDLLDVLADVARRHNGRSTGVKQAGRAVDLFISGLERPGIPELLKKHCQIYGSSAQGKLASAHDAVILLVIYRLSTCPVVSRRVLVAVGDLSGGAPAQQSITAILSGGGWDPTVAARFHSEAPLFAAGLIANVDENAGSPVAKLLLTTSGMDFIGRHVTASGQAAGDSNPVAGTQSSPHPGTVERALPDVSGCGASFVVGSPALDELVLDATTRNKLKSICNAVRNHEMVYEKWGYRRLVPYGRSNTVLFFGPPGTGKTICASAIAAEVGRPLLRVDLSSIFSKWVGETEKNLKKVFDCASSVDAVLLFDEADAVFSKRSESSGASDKYANLQSGYLLQRLEAFDKTVILTTNLAENIDPAFMRRIRFKVEFALPDVTLRRQMWGRMLAPPAPVDSHIQSVIDDLADRWDFSPALISNTCLRAAFEAAAQNTTISGDMLHAAALQEASEGGVLVRSTRKRAALKMEDAATITVD